MRHASPDRQLPSSKTVPLGRPAWRGARNDEELGRETGMKFMIAPAALILLTYCSPGNNSQGRESAAGEQTAGGLSSNDTMPSTSTDSSAFAGEGMATPSAMLSQLNVANTAEIQLAQLVSRKASSSQVKQIARKLATDHSRNQQELQALAQKLNLSLTPAQGGGVADSTEMPADLQSKSGADFDKAFIQHEIEDHQANIDKIRNQMLPAAQDQQVKAYLQKTVTAMEGHLAGLKKVDQQISG
jgi:putative membrane protein